MAVGVGWEVGVVSVDRFATLLYGIGEAAGYLSVPQSTLTTWAYGYERRRGTDLLPFRAEPIITAVRPEYHGDPAVPFIGLAEAYTLAGYWYYREYPDQPQTAGSYVYRPAGSVHTFVCPESNATDTVILIRVEGANVNFTEDGQFHSMLDAVMIHHATSMLAEDQDVPASYIVGGSAGLTVQKR